MANNIVPIIISMFHSEQPSIPVLNKQSSNNLFIYLQEFIKHRIINKNLLIQKNDMLICESLCDKLGLNNENVYNVYTHILELFNVDKIETNDDKLNIIILHTDNYKNNTSIKRMLIDIQTNDSIDIINIPQFIYIYVIRDNKIQIDIQKKIRLDTDNNWIFYSALCKKDDNYYLLLFKDNLYFIYDIVNGLNEIKMDDKQVNNCIKQECIFLIYKISQ
jgi:hypothetical protein